MATLDEQFEQEIYWEVLVKSSKLMSVRLVVENMNEDVLLRDHGFSE